MSDGGSRWRDYNESGSKAEGRPRLLKTLESFFPVGHGKIALDLGAGGGRDSKALLTRGWSVDAVDHDADSIELMLPLENEFPNRLSLRLESFETLTLEPNRYDLINASYSLPFCRPSSFPALWARIIAALKPGGLVSCEWFGENDSWRTGPQGSEMTFLSRSAAGDLLRPLKLELFDEKEFDGPTFAGVGKHWHLFVVVARKRPSS